MLVYSQYVNIRARKFRPKIKRHKTERKLISHLFDISTQWGIGIYNNNTQIVCKYWNQELSVFEIRILASKVNSHLLIFWLMLPRTSYKTKVAEKMIQQVCFHSFQQYAHNSVFIKNPKLCVTFKTKNAKYEHIFSSFLLFGLI